MNNTLLLTAGYEPLKIISWQKAVTLHFLGKVEILEDHDQVLHSPSMSMPVPAVAKLKRYVRTFPRKVKFSRQNLYYRDNYTCQYCRRQHPFSQLTYDHVVPRSKGGKTTWTNVVTACVRCNLKKGNKLLEQANLTLAAEPREPKWLPAFAPTLRVEGAPSVWQTYLALVGGGD